MGKLKWDLLAVCLIWFLYFSFMFDETGIEAVAKSSLVYDCWFVLWVALALVAIVFLILVLVLFICVFIIATAIELVDALEWSFSTLITSSWSSTTTAWFNLSSLLEHLEELLVECRGLLSTVPFHSFIQFTEFYLSFMRPSTASSIVAAAFVSRRVCIISFL